MTDILLIELIKFDNTIKNCFTRINRSTPSIKSTNSLKIKSLCTVCKQISFQEIMQVFKNVIKQHSSVLGVVIRACLCLLKPMWSTLLGMNIFIATVNG